MNIDETKREVTVQLDGKKMTGKWTKQLEDDLARYHGVSAKDEITRTIRHEIAREQNSKAIDDHCLRQMKKKKGTMKFPSRKKIIQTIIGRENSNARFEGRAETGSPKSWNKCSTKTLRECY